MLAASIAFWQPIHEFDWLSESGSCPPSTDIDNAIVATWPLTTSGWFDVRVTLLWRHPYQHSPT